MDDTQNPKGGKAGNSRPFSMSRRRFVTTAGAAAAGLTAGFGTRVNAQERVSEDDPTAQALNYVHDADTVDSAQRPADRYCNNCALYAGNASDEWAPCGIFPGKVVAGRGWCSAWAPKPPQ